MIAGAEAPASTYHESQSMKLLASSRTGSTGDTQRQERADP